MNISFTIPIKPVPCARPRVAKFGKYYPPSHTKYVSDMKQYLPQLAPEQPYEGQLSITCVFVLPRSKTSKFDTPMGDIDNYMKIIVDCMTYHKFWLDDRQIMSAKISKRFASDDEEPHTLVSVISI